MRSVFVSLRAASERDVRDHLDESYSRGVAPASEWCDEEILFIDFDHDGPVEFGPEDWSRLVAPLGGEPSASLIANVSGRHAGDEQVLRFIRSILERFDGLAQDEHTNHLWSLDEVVSGHQVRGHPFFDTVGWFETEYQDHP